MKAKIINYIKKDAMLVVAVIAAVISLFITPPSRATLGGIDWKTLVTLFMLLSVLDGFKNENLFQPVIKFAGRIKSQVGISFFLIFSVFFSSMFVTNDVSLIIFVPLTIILFRAGNKEHYIIPVLTMENIAAIRGSLLTPFGSPQNLFLYSSSSLDAGRFMLMMLPLWVGSMILLSIFIFFYYRKNVKETADAGNYVPEKWAPERKTKRIVYLTLFVIIIATIVSRTPYWLYVAGFVVIALLIFDPKVFRRVDYALIITFLCFFIFSSSIASNEKVSAFLQASVAGHEYMWSILLSQVISNVPASIVLWPFTTNLKALIYGLDSAGLISIIGSLASVINMRIYTREYPGKGLEFIKTFEIISLIFFAIIVIPQIFLY